jgi:anthranilate synthase component 1
VLKIGPGYDSVGDPLKLLEAELSQYRVVSLPSSKLPPLNGGAVGFLTYDAIRWFEPKTALRPLKDNIKIPEALFMIYDTLVALDHFYSTLTLITHVRLPASASDDIRPAYESACATLRSVLATIQQEATPLPVQAAAKPGEGEAEYASNVGRRGYEAFVTDLRNHIIAGDIVQAVPSQRFARRTGVHPYNIYRTLRSTNPSPYMFYISCADFTVLGASPECLMKTDGYVPDPADPRRTRPRIMNHAIAGTIARGRTAAEDADLARQLQTSVKDRAEHVQLVDLARNDVNRVCAPETVRVDRFMSVDRFSHVQHLTSEVSGVLRAGVDRWEAFRSCFPAGTVSGAPKIRAIQLVYDLEQEKRGIYAGASGWFGYDVVRVLKEDGGKRLEVDQGPVDTCIAIRTMLHKDGTAYLQAGGGIVFDSDPTEEWMETMNKVAANLRCLEVAERRFEGRTSVKSVQQIIEEERRK